MAHNFGSHALYLISPNLLLPSIEPHMAWINLSSIYTALAELRFYYTNPDCILQTSDYSTTHISLLPSVFSELYPL